MQDLAEMQHQMARVRDLLIHVLRTHEKEAHNDEPCYGNRLSALAYLAHSLGIEATPHSLFDLSELMDRYDSFCQQRSCPAHPSETIPGG